MKKFLPLFLFAVMLSAATSAQGLRYGVVGAINFDSYSMESADFSIDSDSRVGFRVGFRAEMDASALMPSEIASEKASNVSKPEVVN